MKKLMIKLLVCIILFFYLINVQLGMDHDPWNILVFDQLINLTTYY